MNLGDVQQKDVGGRWLVAEKAQGRAGKGERAVVACDVQHKFVHNPEHEKSKHVTTEAFERSKLKHVSCYVPS